METNSIQYNLGATEELQEWRGGTLSWEHLGGKGPQGGALELNLEIPVDEEEGNSGGWGEGKQHRGREHYSLEGRVAWGGSEHFWVFIRCPSCSRY